MSVFLALFVTEVPMGQLGNDQESQAANHWSTLHAIEQSFSSQCHYRPIQMLASGI